MTFTGNPVLWLLAALAVVALVVFFERLIEMHRAQIDWQDFVKGVANVLDGGNEEEALAICEETSAPVANVVAAAIRHRHGPARALREAVDAQGRVEVGRLDRRLATLAIIGQIAPMLGLLGVVIGFIRGVQAANGEQLVLRADFMNATMEALVAAGAGLAIAIPVAVMYGSLRIRMDRLITELEAAATMIVGYLAAKGTAQ